MSETPKFEIGDVVSLDNSALFREHHAKEHLFTVIDVTATNGGRELCRVHPWRPWFWNGWFDARHLRLQLKSSATEPRA